PSPHLFGAAAHGCRSARPARRLRGGPAAAPLPCCAVTDRGFPARAARGLARPPLRPAPAAGAGSGGAGEVPFVAHLRHAAEHEATKDHRLLALGVPAKDAWHARGAE